MKPEEGALWNEHSCSVHGLHENHHKHFEQVPEKLGRCPYPGRWHRADKQHKKFNITSGFVLCWIACLILQGAHFGADKRSAGKLWRDQPYGLSLPYLQNAMTRNSYVFMRQYIHFADKSAIGFWIGCCMYAMQLYCIVLKLGSERSIENICQYKWRAS